MKFLGGLVALTAVLVVGFCLYWFNPYIEADRAWGALVTDSSLAVDNARQVAERDGLHSKVETAALAKSERAVFVSDCVTARFKYNHTTISEYRVIEDECRLNLLEKDAEMQRAFGVDYGWVQ